MSSKGTFLARGKDGRDRTLRFGDLIADSEWGIVYRFDDASVARSTQKRYALEFAKIELRDLADEQLGLLNSSLKGTFSAREFDESFIAKGELPDARTHEGLLGSIKGRLAEKTVRSFFLRYSYEKDVRFRVHPTDIAQDALDKIDMALERIQPKHRRGVHVDAQEGINIVGVQVSATEGNSNTRTKKRRSVKRRFLHDVEGFDDYVVLFLPGQKSIDAYKNWIREGRPSGGPEQFLSEEDRKEIFSKALQKMFSEKEIEQMWQKTSEEHSW